VHEHERDSTRSAERPAMEQRTTLAISGAAGRKKTSCASQAPAVSGVAGQEVLHRGEDLQERPRHHEHRRRGTTTGPSQLAEIVTTKSPSPPARNAT